jgi:hypothetical protein
MVPQNARVGSPEDPSAAFEAQLSESRELVIDDEAVYWIARVEVGNVRGRHVLRAPKRGGDAALLTDELAAPAGLAVAPTAVYWVDEGESQAPATLRQTDKRHGAKGSGTVVASGETFRRGPHDEHDGRFSLAADEASVYFLSAHDGTVIRVASGGAAVVLASDQHAFNAISVGGGHVYWTWSEQYGRTGGVARVPVAGGPATTLSNDPTPRGVVYDPSGLVVTTSSDLTRLTTCQ